MEFALPTGVGKSFDAIVSEAFAALGCEKWGGVSPTGWSKQSDFQRCPRRYQLLHEMGASPLAVGGSTSALDIGSVGHLLLAAHYTRQLPDDRYPGFRDPCPEPQAVLDALAAAGMPADIVGTVQMLYDGYVEKWANEEIAPVAVEMLAGTVGQHTSRFDLVFHVFEGMHTGLWIGEHKFLVSSTDLDDYTLHGEVIGEVLSFHLSRLHEFFEAPLSGVCLNVILKPSLRGIPTYRRKWIAVSPAAVDRYVEDRMYWIAALQALKQLPPSTPWPRALNGCTNKYRRCRFFQHCRDLDDGQLVLPKKE